MFYFYLIAPTDKDLLKLPSTPNFSITFNKQIILFLNCLVINRLKNIFCFQRMFRLFRFLLFVTCVHISISQSKICLCKYFIIDLKFKKKGKKDFFLNSQNTKKSLMKFWLQSV